MRQKNLNKIDRLCNTHKLLTINSVFTSFMEAETMEYSIWVLMAEPEISAQCFFCFTLSEFLCFAMLWSVLLTLPENNLCRNI